MFKEVVVATAETIYANHLTDEDIIVGKRQNPASGNYEGGVITKEKEGYILRLKDGGGSSGHHPTLIECVESDMSFGYKFYVL